MTTQTKAEKKAAREASNARIALAHAEAQEALRTNTFTCPTCGAGVHINTSLTGWVQCDRSGSGHFRRDPSGAACGWQGFTQ